MNKNSVEEVNQKNEIEYESLKQIENKENYRRESKISSQIEAISVKYVHLQEKNEFFQKENKILKDIIKKRRKTYNNTIDSVYYLLDNKISSIKIIDKHQLIKQRVVDLEEEIKRKEKETSLQIKEKDLKYEEALTKLSTQEVELRLERERVFKLTSEIDCLVNEVSILKSGFDEIKPSQNIESNEEKITNNERNSNNQCQFDEINKKNKENDLEEKIFNIAEENSRLIHENSELKSELESYKLRYSLGKDEIILKDKEINILKHDLLNFESEVCKLDLKIMRMNKEKNELLLKLTEKEREVFSNNEKKLYIQEKLKEKTEEIKGMNMRHEYLILEMVKTQRMVGLLNDYIQLKNQELVVERKNKLKGNNQNLSKDKETDEYLEKLKIIKRKEILNISKLNCIHNELNEIRKYNKINYKDIDYNIDGSLYYNNSGIFNNISNFDYIYNESEEKDEEEEDMLNEDELKEIENSIII